MEIVSICGMMSVVMRRLALFVFIMSIAHAAEPVYLALRSGAGDLAYLSPSGQVLSSVQIGQDARQMAFSRDKRHLLITAGAGTVAIIDIGARRRIADIPLGENQRPSGIAVHPNSGAIAIVTEAPSRLLVVDLARRTVVKHFDRKDADVATVTYGPSGEWAYVTNSRSGTIAAFNIASGEVKSIRTGDYPTSSVLSKDGKELYVANRESNNVAIIDTAKQQVVANIVVGKAPTSVVAARDGNTLVYTLAQQRRVAFADPRQRRQTDYVLIPADPLSCALSNDGQSVLVTTAGAGTVYIVSVAAKRITGEIKSVDGVAPTAILEMPPSSLK